MENEKCVAFVPPLSFVFIQQQGEDNVEAIGSWSRRTGLMWTGDPGSNSLMDSPGGGKRNAGFIFQHFAKNSGRVKTQVFGKTQVFFVKLRS